MFNFLKFKKKSKAKILIVDDEPIIARTLRDRLEMNDYEVISAVNGQEGLKKVLAYREAEKNRSLNKVDTGT